jgi:hypothetical protein
MTTRLAGNLSNRLPMNGEHTATVKAASVNASETCPLVQWNVAQSGFKKTLNV